jgi:hypothetical protein
VRHLVRSSLVHLALTSLLVLTAVALAAGGTAEPVPEPIPRTAFGAGI